MVRTTRDEKTVQTLPARKNARTTGYAIASEYDAESGRLTVHFPEITDEERAFRKALVEQTLAHRDQLPPLGITSAELIREARAEAYGDDV